MDKETALVHLRELLKPGDTVYTVLRHVSASGVSRVIDLYKIEDNEPIWLSGRVKRIGIGSEPRGRHSKGISVRGCGMDMGFSLVYELGRVLWPDGAPKGRGGKPDTDGGYGLQQRWL